MAMAIRLQVIPEAPRELTLSKFGVCEMPATLPHNAAQVC